MMNHKEREGGMCVCHTLLFLFASKVTSEAALIITIIDNNHFVNLVLQTLFVNSGYTNYYLKLCCNLKI